MSMMFEKNNRYVYLSHVPRTGGRYFMNVLLHNGYVDHRTPRVYITQIKTRETRHLALNIMKDAYSKDSELSNMYSKSRKFAVIRNPVDRFGSATKSQHFLNHWLDGSAEKYKKMDDPGYFNYILKEKQYNFKFPGNEILTVNGLESTPLGWFAKQVNFFDHRFAIWKYEEGLGQKFRDFLKKNGVDIDTSKAVDRSLYTREDFDTRIDDFYMSQKLKTNIIKFYEEDYEFWKTYKGQL